MARTLLRQLIGHEDLALGFGKVQQLRGDRLLTFRQIMLEFIFETVAEIKELDYNKYTHVALHVVGPVIQYYYDPLSHLTPDDYNVIKPNSIQLSQGGRWIRIGSGVSGQNQIFDTIIASCSDEFTELTTGAPRDFTTFRCPYPLNMLNGYVRASLTVAPTGSSMIIDIHMNGVSMFSTPIYIDAGELTSVTAAIQSVVDIPDMVIPDDAEFLPYITQIGSTFGGSGLKIAVSGIKVTP
jgi:hypothetical protein